MSDLEDWIKHGDEMRRPLLVNPALSKSEEVIIVGAGLSGLSCAFRLSTTRPDIKIKLIEKSEVLGGVISTWKEEDWICDLAVNAVRPHPAFWRLVRDLNLDKKFMPTKSDSTSRWIIVNGKKHKLGLNSLFKLGPLRFFRSIRKSRIGGVSVSEVIPNKKIADAFTLGIVNDIADNVDADFLMPSITKFGKNPPISKRKLRKKIQDSYPIFTPAKGTLASIEGGMQTITDALIQNLESKENVEIITKTSFETPEEVSQRFSVNLESIIWTCSGWQEAFEETELSIFAVGYNEKCVSQVPKGYGTLIPDEDIPISGILHESDIHHSVRCPKGMRLFRLMVPHSRWDTSEESVKESLISLLTSNKPILFKKLGVRKIPSFKPGHMSKMQNVSPKCSYLGWSVSGVSITHVVDEAERVAEIFI